MFDEMEMTRAKVLVLLAAFNGSKWIQEQVESILCQINVDVHLLISDDGSTDDTRAIIGLFAADRRVQVVSPEVPTRSAAQNFLWLIRNTPADGYAFVSFADQDDVWDEGKLTRGCSALVESGGQGYSSAVVAFWSDGSMGTLAQIATATASDFLFEGAGQGCTYILDREFYCQLRAFLRHRQAETSPLHYHDWAVYALARSWNLKWIFDQKPGVRYRQHEKNDTGARSSIAGIRSRYARIKTGWYGQQLHAIATICLAASPADPIISRWHHLLRQPRGMARQWRMAFFCWRGGRRRWYDRAIVVGAVIAGWI